MAKKESTDPVLKPKERVVATVDMPGIPEGTTGRVILPEGLTWIRYWVRFDNGVVRGTIDRRKLARPGEWAELVRRRESGEDMPAPATAASSDSAPAAAAAEGESVMINGVPVPGFLIERSKQRREFLGV
ncbi:MAG: hypothetical protein QOD92_1626 [Acidimicrobiaceae bacterium]|jgi:hypothetical protein